MTLLNHCDSTIVIDCDELKDDDIGCIAFIIATQTSFGIVQAVSERSQRLANALEKYVEPDAPFNILLVDYIYTSYIPMEKAKAEQPPQVHPDDVVGWTIFARGELPEWVHAVFRMDAV